MNVMFARVVSFGNLFFLLWIDFFSAKTQFLSSLKNRGVSLIRAVDWNVNERFVCTSREFWQFIFIVLDGFFFMPKLSVLARAVDWNTNERDVCTSREFWQFIFLVLDGIFFLPKLSFYLV